MCAHLTKMCVHPEALTRTKNFIPSFGNKCHTPEYRESHNLPDKGYWVARNSSYYRPRKMNDAGEAETTL